MIDRLRRSVFRNDQAHPLAAHMQRSCPSFANGSPSTCSEMVRDLHSQTSHPFRISNQAYLTTPAARSNT
jgi:hypothetical protein